MSPDPLSSTFFALADATRRDILARLAVAEATVNELAEPYTMTLAAVSKHLKVLEGAGLISRGRQAQWRPCRLEAKPLEAVATWVEGYSQFWTRNMNSLDDYLQRIQQPGSASKAKQDAAPAKAPKTAAKAKKKVTR